MKTRVMFETFLYELEETPAELRKKFPAGNLCLVSFATAEGGVRGRGYIVRWNEDAPEVVPIPKTWEEVGDLGRKAYLLSRNPKSTWHTATLVVEAFVFEAFGTRYRMNKSVTAHTLKRALIDQKWALRFLFEGTTYTMLVMGWEEEDEFQPTLRRLDEGEKLPFLIYDAEEYGV